VQTTSSVLRRSGRLQTIADAERLRRTRKARAARRIRKFCGYVCAMRALEDRSRVAYLRSVRDDADGARAKLLVAEARQVNQRMRCINVAMAKLGPLLDVLLGRSREERAAAVGLRRDVLLREENGVVDTFNALTIIPSASLFRAALTRSLSTRPPQLACSVMPSTPRPR
jgi:hypothetical protein